MFQLSRIHNLLHHTNLVTPLKTKEGQLKCATHSTCVLACSNCGQNVEKGPRCFVTKDCDKVYCTNCYRIEGQYAICTICDGIIHKTELSMAFSGRKNIYVECMVCTICSKPLKKGQNMRFDQDFDMLFCEEHAKTQLVTPEIDDQARLGKALVRDAPAFVGALGPTGPASGGSPKGQNLRFDQDFNMLFCEEHAKTQLVTPEINDQVHLRRVLVRDASAFVESLGHTGPASGETFGPASGSAPMPASLASGGTTIHTNCYQHHQSRPPGVSDLIHYPIFRYSCNKINTTQIQISCQN